MRKKSVISLKFMTASIVISVRLCTAKFLIFLIPLLTLAQPPQPTPRPAKTDIVAIVGNRYLLRAELTRKVDKLLAKDTSQSSNEDDEIAFRNYTEGKVVEEWVNTTLLALAAEKQGLKVSTDELQQKLEQLRLEYAPNLNVESALERAGYTRDEFLQEMRDALLGEKLLRDHINKLYT
ncbi:MAG: SurA N-terminal domain-containing protein, partial [Candidatus Sumerlaeia bacterium]|nr:SurA N-terminal domain-containing protein [Candidatus Sumerlaeia bacterium]